MNRFYIISGFTIILLTFFSGCAEKIISDCETAAEKNSPQGQFTFSDIQSNIFNISCALSGCHAGTEPVEALSLSAGTSYKNIVNINSRQNPELKLVLPGNSSQSYLIHKLTGNNTSVMPPSGKLGFALIDSVTAWVDRGALEIQG